MIRAECGDQDSQRHLGQRAAVQRLAFPGWPGDLCLPVVGLDVAVPADGRDHCEVRQLPGNLQVPGIGIPCRPGQARDLARPAPAA